MLYLWLLMITMAVLIKSKILTQFNFSSILASDTSLEATKAKINASLKHADLLRLMKRFNYKPGEGVCFGFTLTWAQDTLSQRDQAFYERLNLIRTEKEDLVAKVRTISYKIRRNQLVDWREDQLLEIKSFIETVCIAQSPSSYKNIYANRITQANINNIIHVAQQGLVCGDLSIKRIFNKVVAFSSLVQRVDFLRHLSYLILMSDNLTMIVSNEQHSVGLKKHAQGWLFLDINCLYMQSLSYPYLLLNDEQLSNQLLISFEEQGTLIINIDFIACDELNLMRRLNQLNDSYPITYQHFSYKNCRNISFIAVCAQSGDEQSIKELVFLHNKKPNYLTQSQISDALSLAVDGNQSEIIATLMQVRELDINFACHSDGTTALGLACKLGNLPLTKLLLTHPLIDINYPNDEGNTPLMLACQCSKQSMELIITLLQAGASLIVQNHEKKNAMEIARENDNQVAVSAIRKYRQSQHLATNAKNNTSPIERQYSLNTVTAYGCTFFTSRRDDYNDKDVQSKYQFPR